MNLSTNKTVVLINFIFSDQTELGLLGLMVIGLFRIYVHIIFKTSITRTTMYSETPCEHVLEILEN